MNKIIFVTFADSKFKKSIERLKKETEDFGFTERYFLSEKFLPNNFFKGFNPKIYRRGYGYWIWKPYIVLTMLEQLNEGDILVFSDAGNIWNNQGIARFKEYLSMLSYEKPIVAFEQPFLTKDWTKGDVFNHICPQNWQDYAMELQLASGMYIIYKCKISMNVFRRWNEIATNYRDLFTDKKSKNPNPKGFEEARHDQSVLNLLIRSVPHTAISWKEVEPLDKNWENMKKYPIWAKREKNESIYDKIKNKIKKCFTIWAGLYLVYCKGFYFKNKKCW